MSSDENFNSFKKSFKKNQANSEVLTPRYQKTEDNLLIMNCKVQICETLLRILEIENDLRMSLFLGFFKEGIESQIVVDIDERDEDGYENRANTSKVHPRETARNNDDNTKGLLSVAPSGNGPSEDNEAIPWLEKVLMGEQIFDSFSQATYVCVLMDLLAYNYTNLNNKAFDLLIKFFNQRAM
jgi:hypothetical protein